MLLKVSSDEPLQFERSLEANGLSSQIVRQKSISELQTIFLSIGGGAGLATILHALGQSVKNFYEGWGAAGKDRKNTLKFKLGDLELECTADNIDAVMEKLTNYLEKRQSV